MSDEKPKNAPKKVKKKRAKPKIAKPKAPTKAPKLVLTEEQQRQKQEKRRESARKASAARWSGERPPSQKELKRRISQIPTAELSVENYSDRPNPQVSWAAAILKRRNSSESQRKQAAFILSEAFKGQRTSPWTPLPPEERSEIARRGGVRRWEIWREEQRRQRGLKEAETDATQ